MTVDVSAIRAALAAAASRNLAGFEAREQIRANAPVWLAALTYEVERLRVDITIEANYTMSLEAERDAALAECERLRNEKADDCETADSIADKDKATIAAWRAGADQLESLLRYMAHSLRELGYRPELVLGYTEALAVHEALKEASTT